MKKVGVVSLLMVLMLIFVLSCTVFGGGIEPPPNSSPDCECLSICGEPDGIKKIGPFLKGTFTAAYEPGTTVYLPESTKIVLHLFLRWGNRVLVVPRYTVAGSAGLCDMSEAFLIGAIYKNFVLCNNEIKFLIQEQFGLAGTPLIRDLVITDKGGCDPTSTANIDDIIRGEITISVVQDFPDCSFENQECIGY